MSRSIKGCWTCRLRHRKCDEKTPVCIECSQRSIPCDGYGPKPSWMDGGPMENSKRAEIQRDMKLNRKLRTRKALPSSAENRSVSAIGEPLMGSSSSEPTNLEQSADDVLLNESETDEPYYDPDNFYPTPHSATQLEEIHVDKTFTQLQGASGSPRDSSVDISANLLSYREANLVMHYFDHVFPLQYSNLSSEPKRSRGWLLWLLMKNKPLHQAVLSLAALHQSVLTTFPVSGDAGELMKTHALALEGLHQFLGDSICRGPLTKQQVVELLACGTSLISFEVFQGGINGWQPHLDGLASILQSARWTADSLNSDMIDSPEMRINSTPKNVFSHQDWTDHAYNFLASVVVWFDILSCVSTGRKPRLDYKAWLQKQEIDLAQVIGCQNWAMDAIGDLASLNAWKVQNTTSKTLSVPQLVKRGEEIQGRLERGLMELETGMEEGHQSTMHAITRVFVSSALVYLQTIISGAHPGVAEIRAAVETAISAFCEIEKQGLSIRSLVWPICIVGSMAEPKHQPYLERLASVALTQGAGPRFGNVETTLQILRRCWQEQANASVAGYGCRDAMADLNICVLLI